MNTSMLLSSVFFMADLVVRGNLLMAQWSSLFLLGALFPGYLGCLRNCSVLGFGRWVMCRSFCGCGHFSALLSLPSKPLLWLQLCEGQGLTFLPSEPSLWKIHCSFLTALPTCPLAVSSISSVSFHVTSSWMMLPHSQSWFVEQLEENRLGSFKLPGLRVEFPGVNTPHIILLKMQ